MNMKTPTSEDLSTVQHKSITLRVEMNIKQFITVLVVLLLIKQSNPT